MRSNQTTVGSRASAARVSSLNHCAGQFVGTSNCAETGVQPLVPAPEAATGNDALASLPPEQETVHASREGFPDSLRMTAVKR